MYSIFERFLLTLALSQKWFLTWVKLRSTGPSGRSPAEIKGSNPTGGMDVSLL